MSARDSFILKIQWQRPDLPSLVGPFPNEDEAREWGNLNIPNGSWNVAPLASPYQEPTGERR